MTQGSISRNLTRYSVPLVLGSFFQLAYNMVDSVIAGRFIGKAALAAEGTASPVMNLLILGISGLSMGAGVLMSEFYGGRQLQKLKEELSTVLTFGLIFSGVAAALGIALTVPLLRLMNVPEEILDITAIYLRIIFLGVPFTYFYNTLAAGLKSIGDSKTPLKFLIFSSVLNAALDLVLLGIFRLGIVCSAATTVVAEAVSALLSLGYIYRRVPELAVGRGEFRLNRELLRKTLSYGSTTALQQACQPVGKLLIQSCINSLGVDTIAAFNAVTRVDDFAFTPEQSISHGITTFVAQNRGRMEAEGGDPRRILRGFREGLALEAAYWVLICTVVLLGRRQVISLFVTGEDTAAMIDLGCLYLGRMAILYLMPAFTNGFQGFFRGYGRMKTTLAGTFIQISIRALGTYLLAPRVGIVGIPYACAAGWACMLLFEVPRYFHLRRAILRGEEAASE